jgi:hypothetical protein
MQGDLSFGRYLMKYPETRHLPSFSSIGVIVSTAACLLVNDVSYWTTTYSPSGAPGRLVL